ncbi:signal peptidase I, partial [Bacillus cereus]|nr:signal peptidase I [Bacillus cereus]
MKLFILKYWRNIFSYIFIKIGVIFINKSFLFCMVEVIY